MIFLKRLIFFAIILLSFGCTSTYVTSINSINSLEFDRTVHKAAKNLHLQITDKQSVSDSSIESGIYKLWYQGISTNNNTSYYSTLLWRKRDDSLLLKNIVTTTGGDSRALSILLPSAIKQQLELDSKVRVPFNNPVKSTASFFVRNFLSSAWGVHYLTDGNPLITKKTAKWVYVQNCIFTDVPLAAGLISYGINPSKKNLETAGMIFGVGLVWKLIQLNHRADIADYNRIAESPYNLSEIKISHE